MENNQANAGQRSLQYAGERGGEGEGSRDIAMCFALNCSACTACSLAALLELNWH